MIVAHSLFQLIWQPECIAVAVVDLNHVFAGSALNTDVLHGAAISSFSQQADSSSYASFTEELANAQASSTQPQNETLTSATLVRQFQNAQSSWQNTTSGSQFGNGSWNLNSADIQTKPTAARVATASGDTAHSTEDSYIADGSKQHLQTPTSREGTISPSTDVQVQSAATKETDRAKHRKENSQAGAVTSGGSKTPAASTSSEETITPATPLSADPTAINSEQAVQNPQTTPAGSSNSKKSRTEDTTGDLAFAVRVQGNSSPLDPSLRTTAAASLPDLSGEAPTSQFAAQMSSLMSLGSQRNSLASSALEDGIGLGPGLVSPAGSQSANPSSAETAAEAPPAEVTKAVEVPDDQITTAQPLKSVQVQISGADNQRVDLRLMEKAGTLTMSVRSADGSLTRALQQHLPELTTSLNDQQIRAEWWKPDIQKTESPTSSDDSSHSSSNNSSTQDQSGQNKGNSGQQGGRSTRQTDWIEELSDLHKSSQNGAQYSWHL